MSLFVPGEVKMHFLFNHTSDVEAVNGVLEIFARREVQLWSSQEIWTLLMECYRDVMKEATEATFREEQEELKAQYEAAEAFFSDLEATSGIEDTLFTVDPNRWGVSGG